MFVLENDFLCSKWKIMGNDSQEKTKDFFICRFRVIIVYQLFESIHNYVVFIVAGIFTVTSDNISDLPEPKVNDENSQR